MQLGRVGRQVLLDIAYGAHLRLHLPLVHMFEDPILNEPFAQL